MTKNKELLSHLQEFVDKLETYYGDLEGFEIKLKHPIVDGERQRFAEIEEFVIYHLTKTDIL